ncbi:MAG: ACT domain-containing protein [Halobacteria archaeon]|nr:ACT domain-containing protein [Halobacteria archaeon]
MSLAQDCREVVSRYPYMVDGLREGVVNYRALARRVKDEVEEEHGNEVDIEAVTTAVRRYGEDLQEGVEEVEEMDEVLSESRVSLRGNVVSITATEVDDVPRGEGFFHLVRGRDYTTVVTDEGDAGSVKEAVEGDVDEERSGLTCITVESPEEIADVPGILSRLVSRFSSERINIVDITSCYTETIIVVEKRDSVKALETLEDVIETAGA